MRAIESQPWSLPTTQENKRPRRRSRRVTIFYIFPPSFPHSIRSLPSPLALSHAPFHILQNPKEIMQLKRERTRTMDGPPLVSLEHAIQEITQQEGRWQTGAVASPMQFREIIVEFEIDLAKKVPYSELHHWRIHLKWKSVSWIVTSRCTSEHEKFFLDRISTWKNFGLRRFTPPSIQDREPSTYLIYPVESEGGEFFGRAKTGSSLSLSPRARHTQRMACTVGGHKLTHGNKVAPCHKGGDIQPGH